MAIFPPQLRWSGVPDGTKSFIILIHDPDAPTSSGWWHWAVYDIPPDASSVERGAGEGSGTRLPAGSKQARTDFGEPGYGGAAPPPGRPAHRYQLKIFAMPIENLPVQGLPSSAMIGFFANTAALAQAGITVLYSRD